MEGSQASGPKSPSRASKGHDVPPPNDESQGQVKALEQTLRYLDLEGLFADLCGSQYEHPLSMSKRPGFNPTGKPISVDLNSHLVTSQPTRTVYQYDVQIGVGNEKRALINAVWNSKTAQHKLGPHDWIFDGNKIAWSTKPGFSLNHVIDMNEERGQESKRDNTFRLQVRQVSQINLAALDLYLKGTASFDNTVLESINFIDHLMRLTPSKNLIAIKRSFYKKSFEPFEISRVGAGVLAARGVYQSLRIGQGDKEAKLVVNADVSNTCFWQPGAISDLILQLAAPTPEPGIIAAMQSRPSRPGGPNMESPTFMTMKRLQRVRFRVEYTGMSDNIRNKTFQVKSITRQTAKQTRFRLRDKKSGREYEENVQDYFRKEYNHGLQHFNLPCVETMKGAVYPAELCHILPAQRYNFKLNENQTSNMIKFAVTRPQDRAKNIQEGLGLLNWQKDPMLAKYGMKINPSMIKTNARLLNPPTVEFGDGKVENPGTNGRWRIDGKRFIEKNSRTLRSWAVVVFNDWGGRDKVSSAEVEHFMGEFCKAYKAYGGDIDLSFKPQIIQGNTQKMPDNLAHAYETITKTAKTGEAPQLLFCIVNAKVTATYTRLKRNLDCRFGLVSQVVQSAHVRKCQAQYIGNVLMKVNAKLGGFSFRALPSGQKPGTKFLHFKRPTVVIGADVSHAGPGSLQPSMAALTMSMDRFGGRYLAACQSNGHRVEMMTSWNLDDMMRPLCREWMGRVSGGRLPQHIIFLRDGVSEGQYEHVLQQEVKDIRNIWALLDESAGRKAANEMKFTVVVASKRHHIRFFPSRGGPNGDRNGNPCPGTLVERDVTHPFQWDFYLCSHTAIQGTARPTHYHVLMDQQKMAPPELINMIYEQCYSYVRSSTPVSIHPAVYYAHLAAKRAVAHERGTDVDNGGRRHDDREEADFKSLQNVKTQALQTGKIMSSSAKQRLRDLMEIEYPPLVPMNNGLRIKGTMWFI